MSASKKSVSKQQLLLIVGAVVVAILLFQLPKMVVNNKKEEKEKIAERPAAQRDQATAQSEDIHKVELSAEEKSLIMSLRKEYNGISDKEKKRIFADSLVNTFLKYQLYDSITVFMDERVAADPSKENLLKAGEAWVQSSAVQKGERQREELEKGRAYFQQILDKNPKDEEARIQMGLSYFVGQQPVMQGVQILRDVVDDNPNSEMGHFYLGLLSVQSKQFDKAVDRFEKVVKINPKNVTAWVQLGLSYKELGQKAKARNALEKARALDPNPEIDHELEELK